MVTFTVLCPRELRFQQQLLHQLTSFQCGLDNEIVIISPRHGVPPSI